MNQTYPQNILADVPCTVVIAGRTIRVDLPNGVRIGDSHWEHEVAKRVAQGIQDAFETFPPRSHV
jgi:hypothetical protein